LSHDSDDSDRPSTLPAPELNPLLNPLLEQNMGRWAEVYFTSPPEKREQAVLELLRELQARESSQMAPSFSTAEPAPTTTGSTSSPAADVPRQVGFASILSGRKTRSDDSTSSDSAPPSHLLRVYGVTALAVVALALAYLAWRGARATSGSSLGSPTSPAVTGRSTVPAQQPAIEKVGAAKQIPSPGNRPITAPHEAAEPPRSEPGTTIAPEKTIPSVPPETTSVATNRQAQALSANGSEELSLAESYLAGTAGKQRDSAEAAKWLWKAVAKHNPEATELLSELYLRGDGVPKNCEQARVLLDAGARRGVRAAADRLAHLQDFGCQ